MKGKVTCSCGHSWSKSDSSKKDVNVCHICGKDNTMKNGGWLEKYNDGGPVQPNYNDYSVSAPEGFQGDGYSNVGRNYSPAWGGQFEDGGKLSFIDNPKLRNMLEGYKPGFLQTVGDYRLPEGQIIPLRYPSTEVSISVGGGDGEPAYLIPSFKYGQPLKNPVQEFNMTGQYLGGPFKTVDDVERFRELRHQYVEKGQPLPSPIATSNMAMGGSMPGSVGFMYARTNDPAPSNGKYAKKTMASAQNGTEMKFYQEGLDWTPKSMDDGGILDPIINLGKRAVNYIGGLFEDPAPAPVAKASIKPKEDAYDTMLDLGFNNPQTDKLKNLYKTNRNKVYLTDKNKVALNTGRFKGANVSAALIDDIAAAAKRNKIPVGQLLALAGRESTFGQQKGNDRAKKDSANNEYMSGWNVAEDYSPYDPHRFLADKKVPGVKTLKSSSGYYYEITDEKAAREYLKKNPQLIEQYKKKLATTPDIGNRNYFDLSAEFLKKKGIQGYNPGDPTYVDMFNQDYNTLKQDKELMSYLKKKGYKYEQGGQLTKLDQLTNFTNYNTKQPGGWLDKYNN